MADLKVGTLYSIEISRPGNLSSVPYNQMKYLGTGGGWFDSVEAVGAYVFSNASGASGVPDFVVVKEGNLKSSSSS